MARIKVQVIVSIDDVVGSTKERTSLFNETVEVHSSNSLWHAEEVKLAVLELGEKVEKYTIGSYGDHRKAE